MLSVVLKSVVGPSMEISNSVVKGNEVHNYVHTCRHGMCT